MSVSITTPEVYTDFQGLQGLKRAARDDPDAALHAVSQQFEALFTKMMLKSMRDASFGDEIFGGQQMDAYQDMFDNQMAMHLSKGQGIGLADVIERQLKNSSLASPEKKPIAGDTGIGLLAGQDVNTSKESLMNKQVRDYIKAAHIKQPETVNTTNYNVKEEISFSTPAEFIEKLLPLAQQASEKSGIAPEVMLAQAALETGWGKGISKHADGASSYNLFNIKADHRWDGERVNKVTLEYKDGIAQKQFATFRSYESFAESFNDFVTFVSDQPRYEDAMNVVDNNAEFITKLQEAGYATDPQYANKIIRVLKGSEMKNALSSIKI